MNTTTEMTVANTILAQLGGNRFAVMTGAKHVLGGPNRLQVTLGRGAKRGINKLWIELEDNDTYTVKFYKMGRAPLFETKLVAEYTFVHADALRGLFERETGLYTSL